MHPSTGKVNFFLYTNLELASVDECVIAVVHSEPFQFPFLKNKKN
jgi:hypothetical protein